MGAGICVHICVITWEFIHVILNWVHYIQKELGEGKPIWERSKLKTVPMFSCSKTVACLFVDLNGEP